jgi:hypothetical protein
LSRNFVAFSGSDETALEIGTSGTTTKTGEGK